MSQVCTIGLDIAKSKFQVHGEDKHGVKIFNKQLRRGEVLNFFANLPACLVGLEACGGSHYWAREIKKFGHDVKLISPRQVKPFVINNKTDAADARAICEVVRHPDTRFVQIKTVDQQYLASLHRVRERLVGNRIALANQIRGFLHEAGIVIPQRILNLRKGLPLILSDNDERLGKASKMLFAGLQEELVILDKKIEDIEIQLKQIAKTNDICERMMKVPGGGYSYSYCHSCPYGRCKTVQK